MKTRKPEIVVDPPRPAPLLDDQPAIHDLLNFGEFAAALRDVIVNPGTRTPFIIGIFGRWGAGKTTLMRMLERDLVATAATTVWFSAWLYGQDKEIWAAFLQSLSSRLVDRLHFADKLRFSSASFGAGSLAACFSTSCPSTCGAPRWWPRR